MQAASTLSDATEAAVRCVRLGRDLDAVTAGLTLSYSSGHVEGAVNRIKMIKREIRPRKLRLLRKRVISRPGREQMTQSAPVPVWTGRCDTGRINTSPQILLTKAERTVRPLGLRDGSHRMSAETDW